MGMNGKQKQVFFGAIVISSFSLLFVFQYSRIWNLPTEYSILNGPDISPSDPNLISKLRNKFLVPPSTLDLDYNLAQPNLDPSMGQSDVIKTLFPDHRNGFFIECGALDGETRSNTLYFEKMGWKGLLIEADPLNFEKLVRKNRKAWSSPTCISTYAYPTMVSFKQSQNTGRIAGSPGNTAQGYTDVQCFPFETYMRALNVTTVDYFSLDVEGSELDVLRTINFDAFNILTLSVEFIHDVEGKDAIEEFMKEKGYRVKTLVTDPGWLANDFMFVKEQHFKAQATSKKPKRNIWGNSIFNMELD